VKRENWNVLFGGIQPKVAFTSSGRSISSTNLGWESRLSCATPVLYSKYVNLGADLRLSGGMDLIVPTSGGKNSGTAGSASDLNIYLNNIWGSSLNMSWQYHHDDLADIGEGTGGTELYNGIYGISRYSDQNSWQRLNLSLPLSDIYSGGMTTFEASLKQDNRNPEDPILGLGLYGVGRGKNKGGVSFWTEMSGLYGDFRMDAGVGVETKLSKKWTMNVSVFGNKITSENNRDYGATVAFETSWLGMRVLIGLFYNIFNTQPAQNPYRKELWTSGPQTLSTDFRYDPNQGPKSVTHKIEIEFPGLKLEDGQLCEFIPATQNDGGRPGVVASYIVVPDGESKYLDITAPIMLKRIEIYDAGVAANNDLVGEYNFPGATLEDIRNIDSTAARCQFTVKAPLNNGYKSYKMVIYFMTNTGDLQAIGEDPNILLTATLIGKLIRLEKK
jgi:hypothetical protein